VLLRVVVDQFRYGVTLPTGTWIAVGGLTMAQAAVLLVWSPHGRNSRRGRHGRHGPVTDPMPAARHAAGTVLRVVPRPRGDDTARRIDLRTEARDRAVAAPLPPAPRTSVERDEPVNIWTAPSS